METLTQRQPWQAQTREKRTAEFEAEINEPGETRDSSFVLPDESLPDVPQDLR